jgi:predicted membrane protein (TIGR00267 family)
MGIDLSFMKVSDDSNIARRYIVLNGFDGILTVLGITVGAFATQVGSPVALISSGMGTAIGLLVSGFSGAYITERAERLRDFKELQAAMVDDMEGSVQEKQVSSDSFKIALFNGASPFFASTVSVVPYMLAHLGIIPMVNTAYILSILISATLLAVFGAFLGRISRESLPAYALKMLFVGLVTAVLSYVLGLGSL